MLPELHTFIAPAVGGSLRYRFAEPWPAWWLVAAGLVLLAYLVYKHSTGTALPKHKLFLGILRATALLIILAMIFRPVLVSEESHIKDSILAIMVDTSQSMSLQDTYTDPAYELQVAIAAGIAPRGAKQLTGEQREQLAQLDRAKLVSRILDAGADGLLGELARKCTPRFYTFSENAVEQEWPAQGASFEHALTPDGRTTGIGEAIRSVTRDLKGQPIAGIVVITDGQSNVGRDAVEAAESYALSREDPFPVFTVGVGDPSEPKDIEVLQIFGNNTVFARDYVLFSVALSSKGFAGRTVDLTIRAGDRVLAARQVELKDSQLQQVPVRLKIDNAGMFECRAVVEQQQGEITFRNNESPPHLLEVIDRPIRVLLVAEKPTWEYRYLKNYLMRDDSVKVSVLLQSADPDFFQEGTEPIAGFPKTRDELFAYDVVVLLGADAAKLSDADLRNVQAFVENVGGGLLVAAQEDFPPSMFTNSPIENLLPVVTGSPRYFDPLRERPVLTQSFQPLLTSSGRQHPITALASEEDDNARQWQNLPELFYYFPAQKLKPGAVSLLEHPTDGADDGRCPLVAVQFYRRGRTMYVGMDSTWRWRYRRGDTTFGRFWGQGIRFLSSGRLLGDNKRLTVASDKPTYVLGNKVVLHARSLGRFYEPARAEQLTATVSSDEFQQQEVVLKSVEGSPGIFRGEFTPAAPGKYSVGLSSGTGDTATEASSSFVVRMPQLEFDNPGTDAATLRKIAQVTGGKYFPITELSGISGEVEKLREEYISHQQTDAWDTPWLLVLVSAMLVTEWTIRKRKMLP